MHEQSEISLRDSKGKETTSPNNQTREQPKNFGREIMRAGVHSDSKRNQKPKNEIRGSIAACSEDVRGKKFNTAYANVCENVVEIK